MAEHDTRTPNQTLPHIALQPTSSTHPQKHTSDLACATHATCSPYPPQTINSHLVINSAVFDHPVYQRSPSENGHQPLLQLEGTPESVASIEILLRLTQRLFWPQHSPAVWNSPTLPLLHIVFCLPTQRQKKDLYLNIYSRRGLRYCQRELISCSLSPRQSS